MSIKKPIDVIKLKKVFRIKNGNLERLIKQTEKWKIVVNRSNSQRGYCKVIYSGRMVFYHTIIWILCNNKDIPLGLEIDHINGNKIDNKIENLRAVTHRENNQNMVIHRSGKLPGIVFNKICGKYQARIKIGKLIGIGYFDTKLQAYEAYKIACTHVEEYIDNESFREIVRKEIG